MMQKRTDRNWFGFWVHALVGAAFGAVIGLGIWTKSGFLDSSQAGLFCIGGGAVVTALVAGFGGEDFWESFRR